MTPAEPGADSPLTVACLCAAWCRLCDAYEGVFESVMAPLRAERPSLRTHWIDIEDESDLLGDLDVETFPMIVIVDARHVRFAGPLPPQPEALRRLVLACQGDDGPRLDRPAPEIERLARHLRAAG